MTCKTCGKEYTPECDYRQGRCPSHPPLLNIQPKDTSKWHFRISIVKSGMRIAAGLRLFHGDLWGAGFFLIVAEVLGIAEELF
jgi:hypothetical protein